MPSREVQDLQGFCLGLFYLVAGIGVYTVLRERDAQKHRRELNELLRRLHVDNPRKYQCAPCMQATVSGYVMCEDCMKSCKFGRV